MPKRKAAAQCHNDARPLYKILDVKPSASHAEVLRAYRLRARQVHPDKNPGDAKATEAFQQLQHAYDVLSDPDRRRDYDERGSEGAAEDLATCIRQRFRPVTPEDIEQFENSYRGSTEERDDVRDFVLRRKGDVSLLLQCIMCSSPSDVDRLLALVEDMGRDGSVSPAIMAAVAKTTPKLRRAASAMLKRAPQEAREAEKVVAAAASAPKRARAAAGSLADLAAAIGARRCDRGAALVAAAEAVAATAPAPRSAGRRSKRQTTAAAEAAGEHGGAAAR